MSLRLDHIPPVHADAHEVVHPAPAVSSQAAGASIDRRSERDRQRGVIGRERNAERCVSAYRDSRKKGTNR